MASGSVPDMEEKSPKITFESWQPEAPAGLSFLSLIQLGDQGYMATDYQNKEAPGKSKVSTQHRSQRRQAYVAGKTVGRDIREEKRLKQAVEVGDISLASKLMELGVDPCSHDNKNRTPLHIAAARGDKDLVKLLLDHGADPNQKDQIGNTALHLAACTRHNQVVTLLLQAGTDVNASDHSGRTPLHLATGRLRMLQESKGYSHSRLQQEVASIIDMMKAYLSKTSGELSLTPLDDITERLAHTSTKAEVDHLGSLLSDFACLQLSGNQPAGGLNTSTGSSQHDHSTESLSPPHTLGGSSGGRCGDVDGSRYSVYRDGDKGTVTRVPNAAQYIQPR